MGKTCFAGKNPIFLSPFSLLLVSHPNLIHLNNVVLDVDAELCAVRRDAPHGAQDCGIDGAHADARVETSTGLAPGTETIGRRVRRASVLRHARLRSESSDSGTLGMRHRLRATFAKVQNLSIMSIIAAYQACSIPDGKLAQGPS